ncbi:sugar ABC transporter ATP-binding protein [Deinococcus cellulosilyticus]|uniref:Sugar ABC transporter ATP-binding protein n=1 Tax=Deinococcus cellulosilyticus (strain DSM 18568 / NBRC 106333 / KACC 11606 / 5516J-15) TaxID=1223518 RepID=A0A511MVD5_DEIC1|nr:sugar ABC transporter ATP-binding protein [Deinococcus cellulosilyticus]GEM44544.1 sugar ABC transporter ATP-binding protein [Deinococcus cellulosilyticus NBRC 106333 = KACC 11606]
MTPSQSEPLLTMQGIFKAFSGTLALKDASLVVQAGEVHALIGQNGAGKSTLLKILTGAYRKDSGSIHFDGREVHFRTPLEAQNGGIATIYQEVNLVLKRSVSENILLGREPRRFGLIDWKEMHRQAEEVLQSMGLALDVRRDLGEYSIATQQMVAIARAISQKAKLVVMDEPTSSLDESEVETLFSVIRKLKSENVAVIFVSHYLDELYAISDRITVMRDGRTVHTGPIQDIGKFELVAKMLGREIDEMERQGRTGFVTLKSTVKEEILTVEQLKRAPRLQNVHLSVRKGEILGVAGLLGSGRTETARVLFGADPADQGTIRWKNQPSKVRSPQGAIRLGMGFCSEDRKQEGIIPHLSVRENLTLALLPRIAKAGIIDSKAQQKIVDKFISRLGIKCSSPEQPIRELSGGNQQKVLLARWLCMNPDLLILDEPTRGIDVGAKAEIQQLISDLAEDGLGVLMISSELEELTEGCHRVVVLRDGETVAELHGEDLSEKHIMHAMAGAEGAQHAGQ